MPRSASAEEITAWCREYIARSVERPIDKIDPDVKLVRIGLDSASSVHLIIALEDWLGIELEPELPVEHPTLRQLSAHIAGLLA